MTRPVPGLPIEQQPEDVVWAMQGCGEARGEPPPGMLAVMRVPVARQLRRRWAGRSLKDILLESWAFSCFNLNDPNRARLLDFWRTDPASWTLATSLVELIRTGAAEDPAPGATHYCTAALWGRQTPEGRNAQWFEFSEIQLGRTIEVARIGRQVFAVAP